MPLPCGHRAAQRSVQGIAGFYGLCALASPSPAGLVEQEWLTTLSAVDPDEVTYKDFVAEGARLAAELRVRSGVARLPGGRETQP